MKLNNRLWTIAGLLLTLLLAGSAMAETVYRVKSSDTVSRVVTKFYSSSGYPRAQVMVAILAKNPDAFRDGNINRLLKGKRLALPNNNEINQISYDEAKQLVSQHALLFRNGIRGQVNTSIISLDSENTSIKVKKQSQKISQLEQESNDLRKQLDNLFTEKKQRDEELLGLEKKIKNYSLEENIEKINMNTEGKTTVEIEKNNQKLRSNNEFLKKRLVESKSELAENERSTMTLERKLSNLRDTMDQAKSGVKSGDAVTSISNNNQSSGVTNDDGLASSKGKYYWVIPLLLVAILLWFLWFFVKWLTGGRRRNKKVFEEEPLEASIKLDVARAYIEADDTASALNILDEVMDEGTEKEKKEAKKILSYLNENNESS